MSKSSDFDIGLQNLSEELKELIAVNNSGGAYIAVCEFLQFKELAEGFKAILEEHIAIGNLTPALSNKRYELYQRMCVKGRKTLGEEIFNTYIYQNL